MRKPLPDRSEIRSQKVIVQVTADEKAQLQQAAENLGMTLSTYCRHVLVYNGRK